jgi:hypothetical protein
VKEFREQRINRVKLEVVCAHETVLSPNNRTAHAHVLTAGHPNPALLDTDGAEREIRYDGRDSYRTNELIDPFEQARLPSESFEDLPAEDCRE